MFYKQLMVLTGSSCEQLLPLSSATNSSFFAFIIINQAQALRRPSGGPQEALWRPDSWSEMETSFEAKQQQRIVPDSPSSRENLDSQLHHQNTCFPFPSEAKESLSVIIHKFKTHLINKHFIPIESSAISLSSSLFNSLVWSLQREKLINSLCWCV